MLNIDKRVEAFDVIGSDTLLITDFHVHLFYLIVLLLLLLSVGIF
jgi:hypothetical protein